MTRSDALHGAANHQQVLGRLQGGDMDPCVEETSLRLGDACAKI